MNLLELAVKIVADDQASEKIRGMAATVGGGLATAAKVGGAAVAAASGATLAFGKSAVDAGMTFDSSMSQVAATMGKTTDEIGDLRDFAQEMGATTAFSASQAADALNYMALAGYDSETSMKMLPNVLNLAAAGNMELAQASDMVTDAQSALGLSLDETEEMVDKMAKASSTTNTSVAQLGQAFLTVGGTAKNLSGGTTELSQALGLLADNGVKGAEGGTALRNIILSLAAPTDKAASVMDALGVTAFDADGKMRPLEDTFADLNGALSKMSDQEKTQALNEIFNKVDLKSVNALLGTNAERWEEVASKIDDSKGAAEAMAKTQLDNLAGDITLLQSAFEGFQIVISDQVTPGLRDFVQFASDSLSNFTTAFKEGGLDGLMSAMSEAVEKGVAMIGEKLPEFLDAGFSLLGALGSGILNAIPTLIEGMGNALVAMMDKVASSEGDMLDGGSELIMKIAEAIGKTLPKVIQALVNMLGRLVLEVIEHAPEMLEAAATLIGTVQQAIAEGFQPVMDGMAQLVGGILSSIGNAVGDFANAVAQFFLGGVMAIGESAYRFADEVANAVQGGVDAVGQFFNSMYNAGVNIIQGLIDGIANNIWSVADTLTGGIQNAVDSALSFLGIASPSKLFEWISEMTMKGGEKGIKSNAYRLADAMGDAVKGMQDAADEGVTIGIGTEYDLDRMRPAGGARGLLAGMQQQPPQVVININDPIIKEEADADRILEYVQTKIQRKAGMLSWNPSASMAWS